MPLYTLILHNILKTNMPFFIKLNSVFTYDIITTLIYTDWRYDMECAIYLDYTMKLLSKIKVPSYIVDIPFVWDNRYDNELRKTIYTENTFINLTADLQEFVDLNCKENNILLLHDDFSCEYIFLKLSGEDKAFMAGPFSFERFTNQRIDDLCSYNSIPSRLKEFMQLYYASLPVFSDERCIEGIITCLCDKLWGNYTLKKKYLRNKNLSEFIYSEQTPEPTKHSIETMEERYRDEALLMEYIAHGDSAAIDTMSHLNASDIKPRLSDSIRDRKNLLIILNTICRKAAQSAYVHPIHLDEISRKFALKIESCTSVAQLEALEKEMTRKYCLLVQSYSLKDYSKPVQNIINYISFNLTADLSLNALSSEFALNNSYVSTLFKKETGTTLTNFVNNKRIDYAIYLLNTTKLPIQDISLQCGITDVNYFTKLFKKLKNMTPTQYREMINKNISV